MNTTPEGNMAPRQGWWSRNWKWVVPVGCLTPVLMCGCFGALVFYFVTSTIKSTDAYQQAVTLVSANPEVQEALGTPIDFGWPRGSVNATNGEGRASVSVPVEGPKGSGTLRLEAVSEGENWTFDLLQVEVPGRPAIDLMDQVGGRPEPELEPLPDDEPPPTMDEEMLPPEEEVLPPSEEEAPAKKGSEIDL
ncbi:cytochrome c oxidase assembly factor 1 family protein [Stigmatella sp. ncwal1]|uniref:Cytochrome c oxidase assembly factor 1 family protein n=1 Tax=Stigmatella ashevillensis TaxID=2995309 RepID=A0ABT5D8C2_9BACT|nr:cytochrome c oxidase assembly factor 1 family protein [Stigmatella ashevillena]MDC0709912.1 cytochrome c oxidase assembly factor 1 family protein [Stigmatella ashevillena]